MGWSPLRETASKCQSGHGDVPKTRRGDHDEGYDNWIGSGDNYPDTEGSRPPPDLHHQKNGDQGRRNLFLLLECSSAA